MESMLGQRVQVSREQWAIAFGISAMAAAILVPVAAQINAWIGVLTAIFCFAPLRGLARRMPVMVRGAQQRRPVLSLAWLVLVLVAVAQMTRLSAFMVDSSRLWGSAVPDPAAANHQVHGGVRARGRSLPAR
jgi:hypothetical protein